jgi:preprotein translocase subunit SecF
MSKLGDLGHRLYTGEVSYDFVGRQKVWYTLSAVILLMSVGALLFRGMNFGIEFRGGAEFRVPQAQCSVAEAREGIQSVVTAEPIVQELGNGEIRVQTESLTPAEADEVTSRLVDICGVPEDEISRQVIGPTWGGEVTNKAVTALVVFLALVVVFISIAFEFKMAIAAFVALLHDIVITVGLYALVGFEVTPATVIGLLTILGYSLYDTIVVFDSLRENTRGLQGGTRMTYSEAANLSINQTLVRSINTSVIALLPVAAILFVGAYGLGAGVLKDLSLVLFIGIAASTFSSIFIATPLLADLKEREPAMAALRKRVMARRSGATGSAARRQTGARTTGRGGTAVLVADDDEAPGEDSAVDARPAPTAPGRSAAPRPTRPAKRTQPKRGGKGRPRGKKKR